MRLGLVVAKIIAADTRFEGRVGGAAELSLAWDGTLEKDMAFVVPLSDIATPNTGDVVINQKLTEGFSIVVALANDSSDRDKVGFAAYDAVHNVRAELWGALLGWQMPDMEDLVSYTGGRISKIDRSYLWYQFDFECGRRVEQSDGVTEEATDMFNTIYAQLILSPDIVLPYTGALPYDPFERAELELLATALASTVLCFTVFENKLYAGTGNEGKVFRSHNGSDWELVLDTGSTNTYAACEFKGKIYIGQSPYGHVWSSSTGDLGSWTRVADFTENTVSKLRKWKNYLYAGTSLAGTSKVYRSSDGSTWVPVLSSSTKGWVREFYDHNGYLYTLLDNEIYRTQDGIAWSLISVTNGNIENIVFVGKELYAGASLSGATPTPVYKSTNWVTWTHLANMDLTWINCLVYFYDYLIVGGPISATQARYYYSKDGIDWKVLQTVNGTTTAAKIFWENNLYFGLGLTGDIYRLGFPRIPHARSFIDLTTPPYAGGFDIGYHLGFNIYKEPN